MKRKLPARGKKTARFGVYDVLVTAEDRIRWRLRELAHRLHEGTERTTDKANAANKLELLASHPSMLSVLGQRYSAPDVYHWLAYHAVLCELLDVKAGRRRVADFWSRSVETIQDALTDRRAGLMDEVKAEIRDWRSQGFTAAEILASYEETRLAAARAFIFAHQRTRKTQRRKK